MHLPLWLLLFSIENIFYYKDLDVEIVKPTQARLDLEKRDALKRLGTDLDPLTLKPRPQTFSSSAPFLQLASHFE